ncbi:MAG TPA: HAMP domain-containing protein, partial [Anaerolineae bacterium]|nr:HAMP domain-containing protein [Anaerolineae bacterium]
IALVVVARQFSSYSLRGKLVSATIAVALLAVMAVAVGINLLSSRTISQAVGQNLNTLAASHALSIGEFLARKINTLEALAINRAIVSGVLEQRNSYEAATRREIENQLKALSGTWTNRPDDDPLVTAILNNELVPELSKFQTVFPDNVNLLVTDQFGAPVAATYRPDSYYQGNAKWWRDAYMSGFGSAYIGRPEFDVERDAWIVDMAVPIHGEVETGRTQIVGVLHATFSLDALADIMVAARFGETGEVEIHLPGTQVLEVTEGKLALETNELRPVVEQMQKDGKVFTEIDHHAIDTLISAAGVSTLAHEPVVDATNWQVVVHQDRAEGLEPVSQQGRFNTVLGLIVIFSAGVVAWIVGTRLTEPITSLTETAVEVSQGNLEARSDVQSEDELGTLAAAFNVMTDQLQGAISNLEQRVAERTQALAISIDVGRRLLTIHDQDELVTEVVEEVRDAFDYYHVHIYLLDEDGETLTMAGGTGEAGQIMLDNQHQIKVGQGLVGRAAVTNTVVLVPDVTQEESWLPNELLPETKAEAAVPISIGDEVLGVLDVQADQVNSLEEADADVLLSITNQVAIALQNARLLEGERERSENEARINEINQKLLRTTTIEAALQVAAREIGRAVDAPRTRVVLKQGDGKNGRHS